MILAGRAVRSLLVMVCLAGCTGSVGGESAGRRGGFISNGHDDPGHPTVGLLHPTLCTATLVGGRTVLTAAHCIEEPGPYSIRLDGKDYEVTTLTPHPEYAGAGKVSGEPEEFAHDLAVLRLAEVPGVTPSPLLARAPAAGEKLVLVGYGATSFETADWGLTKRWASNQIATLAGDYLHYTSASAGVALPDPGAGDAGVPPASEPDASEPDAGVPPASEADAGEAAESVPVEIAGNVCPGDSGGPSFVLVNGLEAQVGVHSMGDGQNGFDRRVDLHLDWIKTVADGDLRVLRTSPAAR
jgi:hypothetical protein